MLDFDGSSSSCSFSCDRIKQSQLLILRLNLKFDNWYQVYCDKLQILNAYRAFIIQGGQIIGGKFTSKKGSPKNYPKMSYVMTSFMAFFLASKSF